jgi:hypothetical protein
VELVDQTGREQVVPHRPAAEDEDLASRPALQLGDPLVRLGAADDPRGLAPRLGLLGGDGVRDDDLLDRVVQARDLDVGGSGVRISAICGQKPLNPTYVFRPSNRVSAARSRSRL